ncbi:unnamed protein product [marine sediment metagenome]|uniref:Uncharacterized protein n=1 Tax=marine sediment metagenome TaxID=412755 RepID=X1BF89_9ZZZZ
MRKVLDKDLEKAIEGIVMESKNSKTAAAAIVETLRKTQDAGGMKVCQNVTVGDPAYKKL